MSNQCLNEVRGGREVRGNGKRKNGIEFRREIRLEKGIREERTDIIDTKWE